MSFIDEIRASSRQRAKSFIERPLPDAKPKDLHKALSAPGLSVIAEVKMASPSAGPIRQVDAASKAKAYEDAGACAVSVLTEPHHFSGSLDHLLSASSSVNIPVIRKDFLVEPVQIHEARAYDADAVLLIVSILGEKTRQFISLAHELGMAALVEVHDEAELEVALSAGASIIGVNNRDFKTMLVDIGTCERILPLIPQHVLKVAESGIKNPCDARRMRAAGADAVLVGSLLMRDENTEKTIASLRV